MDLWIYWVYSGMGLWVYRWVYLWVYEIITACAKL